MSIHFSRDLYTIDVDFFPKIEFDILFWTKLWKKLLSGRKVFFCENEGGFIFLVKIEKIEGEFNFW